MERIMSGKVASIVDIDKDPRDPGAPGAWVKSESGAPDTVHSVHATSTACSVPNSFHKTQNFLQDFVSVFNGYDGVLEPCARKR